MQIASIEYRLIKHSNQFEYHFSYNEDDPQKPYNGDGYEIDYDPSIPLVARTFWVHFNYKANSDEDKDARIVPVHRALELLRREVTTALSVELLKLESQKEWLYILRHEAYNKSIG